MNAAVTLPPPPTNEPVLSYAPGTRERARLADELGRREAAPPADLPLIINGRPVFTGRTLDCILPHRRRHVLARAHQADAGHVQAAVDGALRAGPAWGALPWESRAAVFLKAAELIAGPRRAAVNAVTMLNQSKSVHQAEIDAACETADFWRFNVHFYRKLLEEQPLSSHDAWNRLDQRPLEGFVAAITPFNFTSIGANLPTAPALCGNTVVWKPAATATAAAHVIMDILIEAGLPPGVIQLVTGPGSVVGPALFSRPEFAGVHFTGSTDTFRAIWRTVGEHIERYRGWPRLVGETGGKDFVVVHPSAPEDAVVTALVRGAFEYQGQKCSAASRAYLPASRAAALLARLAAETEALTVGDPADFGVFFAAVIDRAAFDRIGGCIDYARTTPGHTIVTGGARDDAEGFFVQPTVVRCDDPFSRLMTEEIFGPVLAVYVYDDGDWSALLDVVDRTSPYALTGAVFAADPAVLADAQTRLRFAAGNLYLNDKPTGAVVGRQPFGGARASGTNDKAGSALNLQRWLSPRAIKETFVAPTTVRYPHQG